MESYEKKLSEMSKTQFNAEMKKYFNEYFAKVVLESCFPQKFDFLEILEA